MTGVDWSDRHRRLRRAMVLCALAVFATARVAQAPGNFLLEAVGPSLLSELRALLLLAALYFLIAFLVCSSAESRELSRYARRLGRILHRITETRREVERVHTRLDGMMVSRRLEGWERALGKERLAGWEADRKAVAAIRDRLDALRATVEGLSRAGTAPQADGQTEHAVPAAALGSEATRLTRDMDRLVQRMAEQTQALEAASAESRQALADARTLFSNREGTGADDLNRNLMVASANLKGIYRGAFLSGQRFRIDRVVFGVHLPVAISAALLVLALTDTLEPLLRLLSASGAALAGLFSGL